MKKKKGVKQSQSGRMEKIKVASNSTSKSMLPPSPPWLELPEDVMATILQKLGPIEIMQTAQKVCKAWCKICRDPTMWRVIDMWNYWRFTDIYRLYDLPFDFEMSPEMKSQLAWNVSIALDLSQGQVTEINIEDFANDYLLQYIASRCGNLRCLRLFDCHVSLSKTIKGFPLLEELHLQCIPVEKDDIEAIGQSCPMLKTFALNERQMRFGIMENNEEALAVAASMPELRHLQLFRNGMTNEALEAILNGCPKLESLDLRHCWHLNLEGELEKRCAQQIKVLRRPCDPTDDYVWDVAGDMYFDDDCLGNSDHSGSDDYFL